ncbi:MAG: hypothetical protein AAGD40_04585 [Pseudomonadota bacterium]
MRNKVATLLVGSAMVLGAAPAAANNVCWQPHEVAAAEVRNFQSLLMVGTLQCDAANRFVTADYNRFVQRSRQRIQDNNRVIRARFVRAFGPTEGESRYDRFTTRMANEQARVANEPGFCGRIASLSRIAADAHPNDMVILAQSLTHKPKFNDPECRVSHFAAAAPVPTAAPLPAASAGGVVPVAATDNGPITVSSDLNGIRVHRGAPSPVPAAADVLANAAPVAGAASAPAGASVAGAPRAVGPELAARTTPGTMSASERIQSAFAPPPPPPPVAAPVVAPEPEKTDAPDQAAVLAAAMAALESATEALRLATASAAPAAAIDPGMEVAPVAAAPVVAPQPPQ